MGWRLSSALAVPHIDLDLLTRNRLSTGRRFSDVLEALL